MVERRHSLASLTFRMRNNEMKFKVDTQFIQMGLYFTRHSKSQVFPPILLYETRKNTTKTPDYIKQL